MDSQVAGETKRLPFDRRCAATTKTGRRCKGRICRDSEFCAFHQPGITSEQRRSNGAKGGRQSRYLATLPGGYLSKITTRRSVGVAMDRLYREVRTGLVTPEMGNVLFAVLTRMLDSGLLMDSDGAEKTESRSRAARVRPKLASLLTQAERRAWRQAVDNAPDSFIRRVEKRQGSGRGQGSSGSEQVALPAAS